MEHQSENVRKLRAEVTVAHERNEISKGSARLMDYYLGMIIVRLKKGEQVSVPSSLRPFIPPHQEPPI